MILAAILVGGAAFAAFGAAIGSAAREVRASSLLAFMVSLPIAFLSLVPSGPSAPAAFDALQIVRALFPFDPSLVRDGGRARRLGAGDRGAARPPRRARRRLRGPGAPRLAAVRGVSATRDRRPRIPPVSFPATRMRRMRSTKALRDLVRETDLSPRHLIQPLFVVADEGEREPVASMPGVDRLSINQLVEEAGEIQAAGVPGVILFGIPRPRTTSARAPTTTRASCSSRCGR